MPNVLQSKQKHEHENNDDIFRWDEGYFVWKICMEMNENAKFGYECDRLRIEFLKNSINK